MQWFSYLDKREVLQQEYSQPPILPSPHFRWVVKGGGCIRTVMFSYHTITTYNPRIRIMSEIKPWVKLTPSDFSHVIAGSVLTNVCGILTIS